MTSMLIDLLMHEYKILRDYVPETKHRTMAENAATDEFKEVPFVEDRLPHWQGIGSNLRGYDDNSIFTTVLSRSFLNYKEVHNCFNEQIACSADVTRLFSRGPGMFMEIPFKKKTFSLCQEGPSGSEDAKHLRVDVLSCMTGLETPLQIVCHKNYGYLLWVNILTEEGTVGRERQTQLVRRQAYEYNCPQVTLYDAETIICFIFKAENRENIKNCDVDIMYGKGNKPNYLLVMMQALGINRAIGEQCSPVYINGWTCEYRWYDGRPRWTQAGRPKQLLHPQGWNRRYNSDQGRHFWVHERDQQVFPERYANPQCYNIFKI